MSIHEPVEVEVKSVRVSQSQVRFSSRFLLKAALSLVFGSGCALAWHFIHGVSEPYQLSPSDPHFWFHLVVEITVALYTSGLFFILWTLVRRFHLR